MKKLLLGACAVAGLFAGPVLMAIVDVPGMTYSEQVAYINEGLVKTLEALGEQPITAAQFDTVLNVLDGARDIINFQVKSSSVSASNKQKLVNAAVAMQEVLHQLKSAVNENLKIVAAKNAIKTLESKLKTLNVGLTDYQTTVDLKNGLKKATEGFLKTLRMWALVAPAAARVKNWTSSRKTVTKDEAITFCKGLTFEVDASQKAALENRCQTEAPRYLAEVKTIEPGTEEWSELVNIYAAKGSTGDKLYEAFLFDLQSRQEDVLKYGAK